MKANALRHKMCPLYLPVLTFLDGHFEICLLIFPTCFFFQDFPIEVLQLIRDRSNICSALHVPAQSGNNRILSLMHRNYTREAYLNLVDTVLDVCGPRVTLSSDFICGFCSETEEEFRETLDLVGRVPYSVAYIFAYSMREVFGII